MYLIMHVSPHGGFFSISGKASYAVRLELDLEVAVANVLDQDYQVYAGYPEPGRSVSVGFRHRF
jgi:outer membrane cobalamin receptor